MVQAIWDYDEKILNKSKKGTILLLERLINYGIFRNDNKKIPLKKVKKYWNVLSIEPKRKKLLQRLLNL